MVDFIVWPTLIYRLHMETFTESYENGRKGQTYINLVASGNRKFLNDERFHTALRSWPSISGTFARSFVDQEKPHPRKLRIA